MSMPKSGPSPMSYIANPISLVGMNKSTQWLDPVGMMMKNNPSMQKFDPLGGMLGAYPAASSTLQTGAQLYGRRTSAPSSSDNQANWNSRLQGQL
jgi:hypothetical protein